MGTGGSTTLRLGKVEVPPLKPLQIPSSGIFSTNITPPLMLGLARDSNAINKQVWTKFHTIPGQEVPSSKLSKSPWMPGTGDGHAI